MRYLGQWRSLSVPTGVGAEAVADAVERFHDEHEREFSYRRDDAPVEIYRLELQAIGVTPKAELAAHEPVPSELPEPRGARDVLVRRRRRRRRPSTGATTCRPASASTARP